MLNSISNGARGGKRTRLLGGLTALLVGAFLPLTAALADDSAQRVFPTPQAAVDGLVAAAKEGDPKPAVAPILGPDADKIVSSDDPLAAQNPPKTFFTNHA